MSLSSRQRIFRVLVSRVDQRCEIFYTLFYRLLQLFYFSESRRDTVTVDLWGQKIPQPRHKKKVIPLTSAIPYAITDNDCAYFGHTLREWDLAGCTLCIDCG